MRLLPLILMSLLSPSAGLAHVGHLGDVAGHDHWVAGAAIGIAIALGLWAGLKGKRDDDGETDGEDDEQTEAST